MNTSSDKSVLTHFENTLGTASAQKIIRLLVCWSILSISDLKNKSGLSKSQLYATLNNLASEGIVYSKTRGNYSLTDSLFTKNIIEAYKAKIIEIINKEIYDIKLHLKQKELSKAESKYKILINQFDPILNEHFPFIMSSLANRFIESYK